MKTREFPSPWKHELQPRAGLFACVALSLYQLFKLTNGHGPPGVLANYKQAHCRAKQGQVLPGALHLTPLAWCDKSGPKTESSPQVELPPRVCQYGQSAKCQITQFVPVCVSQVHKEKIKVPTKCLCFMPQCYENYRPFTYVFAYVQVCFYGGRLNECFNPTRPISDVFTTSWHFHACPSRPRICVTEPFLCRGKNTEAHWHSGSQ